jgi:hypothetical protein
MRSTSGVELLGSAVEALGSVELSGLADGEVRELLLGLWRESCRVQAQLTRLVGSFDARQAGQEDAARSTGAWLRAFCRMTGGQAAAQVRAARAVAVLPGLAEAFAEGAVNMAHVDRVAELARRVGAERVVQVEQTLVAAARVVDATELGVLCDRVRAYVDPDGASPEATFNRRGLTLGSVDGMVVLKGQLDAEGGATVATALDALMKPAGEGDDRNAGQRRADALVELARGALHGGTALPTVAGQRPHLGVLVNAETLANATDAAPHSPFGSHDPDNDPGWNVNRPHGDGPHSHDPHSHGPHSGCDLGDGLGGDSTGRGGVGRDGPGGGGVGRRDGAVSGPGSVPLLLPEPGFTPWAGPLSGPTLRRLACDSVVWRVVLDPANGLPLDLGRQHRVVPGWLRRALYARDRGCRFPGCAAQADWCDGHHLTSWLDGGETAIDNLILVCRYHHVRIHEHGWKISVEPATGAVTATRPDGRPYEIRRSSPYLSAWGSPLPYRDQGQRG